MIRKFFHDGLIYTIPSFLSKGLSIILVPLYTRVLTPADYGALDLILAFGALVNLIVALEVSQGVARYYSDEKDECKKIQYVSTAFWFTLFCYGLFLSVTFFNASLLSPIIIGRSDLNIPFRIGILYICVNGIYTLTHNQFRWELKSMQFAITSILVTISTSTFAIIFAFGLGWSLPGLLLGMLLGSVTGLLYGIIRLRDSIRRVFSKRRLKEMLVFSAPLVPSSIAVFVSHYIDRLMINHFLSQTDLGLYGIAFRLSSIVSLAIIGFQGALTPLIYTHFHSKETPANIAAIFRAFLFFAVTLFYGLSAFADEILHLLATPEYYPAANLVVFLVPGILISNMYVFAPGIGIAKKTHFSLWINVIGAITNTCLNYYLIPMFSTNGAAVATLLGFLLVFTLNVHYSQKFYPIPYNWILIAKAFFISCIAVFIARSLPFNLLANILLKCCLGVTLLVILSKLGLITQKERAKFFRLVFPVSRVK